MERRLRQTKKSNICEIRGIAEQSKMGGWAGPLARDLRGSPILHRLNCRELGTVLRGRRHHLLEGC